MATTVSEKLNSRLWTHSHLSQRPTFIDFLHLRSFAPVLVVRPIPFSSTSKLPSLPIGAIENLAKTKVHPLTDLTYDHCPLDPSDWRYTCPTVF